MNQDVKDRICAAADRLFAASETNEFPTVEQVRKEARASMNNVVEVLKEWRQKQRTVVRSVMEPLPEALHLAVLEFGQSLWKTAQDKANESLEVARSAFEAEKADLTRLSLEQSQAFEQQALELEALRAELAQASEALVVARQTIDTHVQQLAQKQEKVALAEARTEEIQKRADGLLVELDRVHAEAQAEQHKAAAEVARLHALLETADKERTASLAVLHVAQEQAAIQKAEKEAYTRMMETERDRERTEARAMAQRLQDELAATRAEGVRSAAEAAQCQGELKGLREQVQEQLALIKAWSPGRG